MPEQRSIRFFGSVQGVGFRWTARRIADRHPVAGWVKNAPDGTVEMLLEGEPEALDAYLADVRDALGEWIEREAVRVGPPDGEIGFTIRS